MRRFDMRDFSKIIIILFVLSFLTSCSEKLAPKRSISEQLEVKKQVMLALENYYKQPFKLEDFSYKYETDYKYSFFYIHGDTSGQYIFKINAVDNPIIKLDFVINDNKKESIKLLINSFKKDKLTWIYCLGLNYYYKDLKATDTLRQPYVEKTEQYCDSTGEDDYKLYKAWYIKHQLK